MHKGGRPMHPVWDSFTRKRGKSVATCNYCQSDVSAKSDRLKTHLKKCRRIKNNSTTSADMATPSPPSNNTDDIQEIAIDESTAPATSTPPKPKKPNVHQPSIIFGVKTDSKTRALLDEQVANFFYACNIPFNVASHDEFIKMVEMLRPGYCPPNRKALANELLDKTYENISMAVKAEIGGEEGTLTQDGWSDIHNTPVIASSLHVKGKPYFLSAKLTGTSSKTAAYCQTLAEESMEEAASRFDCKVSAVVTDNENKMKAMRNGLKEAHPDLTVYGCASHWLNLLGQDVTTKAVINQVVEINKYFRNHHKPGAYLEQKPDSVKPQLPGDTRWNSQLDCVSTYLKNRASMLLIIAENEDDIDARIASLVQNVGLYTEAKSMCEQLKPIGSALDRLQSDSSTIADACETFLDLLRCDVLSPHRDAIKKRFDQAMVPEHFLANLLHPVYRGQKLSAEQVNAAQAFLLDEAPEIASEVCQIIAGDLPIPKALAHPTTRASSKPDVWWKCVARAGAASPLLSQTAIKLSLLPSSAASIERVFSNFGMIQTKLRNRLGVEKAAKLVACYRYLRGKGEVDW